jgi:hypothetical protein
MAGVVGLVGRGFAQVESAVSRVADARCSGEAHHSSPVTDTGPPQKASGLGSGRQHVNFCESESVVSDQLSIRHRGNSLCACPITLPNLRTKNKKPKTSFLKAVICGYSMLQ